MNASLALLPRLIAPEWRHHPLRQIVAVIAIALGVGLAYAVHLINSSALSEFGAAVRAVNGQPDLSLRAIGGEGFDERLYARVAQHPWVAMASPVLELETQARGPDGERLGLKLIGQDAFSAGSLAPALAPRLHDGLPRERIVSPDALFLNPQARARLGDAAQLELRRGDGWLRLPVDGSVAAEGPPLAVIDIAGAQQHFGRLGQLSRIDLRLRPGADRGRLLAELALPPGVQAATPDDSALQVSNLSRAYRVNLTVLALVALFTGGFLVFSVLALAVAQRGPQLALLGVLGLDAAARRRLVLAEAGALGVLGSLLGLALGAALAAAALRYLAGDLGGGYFPGVSPRLQLDAAGAALHGVLGVATALAGAWLPARLAERIAPAQTLKGLGDASTGSRAWALAGPLALLAGAALAFLPPILELPIAAYLSVAALLLGGIACVPAGVAALLRGLPRPRQPLLLLALERARDQRHQATIAVAGVVASLSLAVALTVMVTSFRHSVTQWLDTVLPADLYLRGARNGGPADGAALDPGFLQALRERPEVAELRAVRSLPLQLRADRPAVRLVARDIGDATRSLPLVGARVPPDPALPPAYVSEALRELYGVQPGDRLELPLTGTGAGAGTAVFHVRGVWRDYARQHGAVAIEAADYRRLTGDTQVNEAALRLRDGVDPARAQQALRALAPDPEGLDFASAGELRAVSMAIFDRSFAVTWWLQGVAIGIGLFGIAASFSAQVLARRKELGLLAHLGLTRRQILQVVAAEGAAWTAAGGAVGIALGLAVSLVLVHVVNPQSFHWTMDLTVPWGRLALLYAAVLAAGTLTAWLAARRSAGVDVVLAVKDEG